MPFEKGTVIKERKRISTLSMYAILGTSMALSIAFFATPSVYLLVMSTLTTLPVLIPLLLLLSTTLLGVAYQETKGDTQRKKNGLFPCFFSINSVLFFFFLLSTSTLPAVISIATATLVGLALTLSKIIAINHIHRSPMKKLFDNTCKEMRSLHTTDNQLGTPLCYSHLGIYTVALREVEEEDDFAQMAIMKHVIHLLNKYQSNGVNERITRNILHSLVEQACAHYRLHALVDTYGDLLSTENIPAIMEEAHASGLPKVLIDTWQQYMQAAIPEEYQDMEYVFDDKTTVNLLIDQAIRHVYTNALDTCLLQPLNIAQDFSLTYPSAPLQHSCSSDKLLQHNAHHIPILKNNTEHNDNETSQAYRTDITAKKV